MTKAERFAEETLSKLDEEFTGDDEYCEVLEELLDRAQTALDAKREEMEEDEEEDDDDKDDEDDDDDLEMEDE